MVKSPSHIMSFPVQARPIETKAEYRQFFEFPWVLYKNDPNWVPPLLSMRRDLLDKKKNPAWSYMEGQYFGAWRGETLVGTITGFINHRHNEFWDEQIGWFGTFDTYDDREAATALLAVAEKWVQERGYLTIRGPQSFTTHEETGLLVENFNPPILMMPYNYPYYEKLIQDSEYEFVRDVVSLYIDRKAAKEHEFVERLDKIVERNAKRGNITIRQLNAKRKKDEFRIFRDIYNQAWDKNWGFVPMNDSELDALVESLGMFVEPEMAFFAEVNGDPAGFILTLPDFNELLHKAYPRPGVPEIWSLLKIGWNWKVAKVIKGLRVPLMGVKSQYRNMGIDLMMFHATIKAIPERYTHADASWILDTNPLIKIGEKLGTKIYKRHRYYQKHLT